MLKSEQVDEVRKLLIAEATRSPIILGARIGDIVKQKFPDQNVKKHYGSIKNFVERDLSDTLIFHARKGIDNMYSFLSSSEIPQDANELSQGIIEQNLALPADQAAVNRIKPIPFLPKRSLNSASSSQNIKSTDASSIRALLKDAIDVMTVEQLRQLAIPAGILLDAITKKNRV